MPPFAGEPELEDPNALPSTSAQEPVAAAEDDKGPSPLPPIGIGLATASLAAGVPWWLGRRNGW